MRYEDVEVKGRRRHRVKGRGQRVNPLIAIIDHFLNFPHSFNTLSGRQVLQMKIIISQGVLSLCHTKGAFHLAEMTG